MSYDNQIDQAQKRAWKDKAAARVSQCTMYGVNLVTGGFALLTERQLR